MKNSSFEKLIFRASLGERAERYEDMVKDMKEVMRLSFEENREIQVKTRNLFSVAYKNLAGARRASWRILAAEKLKVKNKDDVSYEIADDYIKIVEKELHEICDDVLRIIDEYVLKPEALGKNIESRVFFLKMKADYFRYKAEVCSGEMLDYVTRESNKAYEEATKEADMLPPTNPIRLGLALNFSVFYYEILKGYENACNLAKKAFDDAIAELDQLSEDHYKDSTLIMQLLRDNLTLWTNQEENIKAEEAYNDEEYEKEEQEE